MDRTDPAIISRRTMLALTAAIVVVGPRAAGGHGAASVAPYTPDEDPFALGVCSGDPDDRSAVLWTRLTTSAGTSLPDGDIEVTWELADDPGFAMLTGHGTAVAVADHGHSVHVTVDVTGPTLYRFRVGPWISPTGRVAPTSAPATTPSTLRLAATTCQHFETGYYAAHRDLAEWQPDLVVFLGDFIYEGASRPVADGRVRSHDGGEPRDLDGYRGRYAQYLADDDLQASRAACPWLVIWDDHEVENNYAGLTSEEAEPLDAFAARRLRAYQAWWEHMPVRIPRPRPDTPTIIYRTIPWGSLADVIMLDGRQFRSDQACGDTVLSIEPACPEASDPSRTMLGREQEAWLDDQLASTRARWPVIAQQTVLTDLRLANGGALNYDQWDGYAPARDRLLLSAAAHTERTIVLTGDIHLAGVGLLPGVGVEFVTTSVSSAGLVPVDFGAALSVFPHIVGAELAHRGYIRHTVDEQRWVADYRIVHDATDPASAVSTWKSFAIDAGARDVAVETSVGVPLRSDP